MSEKERINNLLQKGIEAHQSGNFEEADRFYTAILKADPKHPDANHNMGVLAVSVKKPEKAIPFLRAALETKPTISQFWLSYIEVLIKLNRLDAAKLLFEQAQNNGLKGEVFDRLEQRLHRSNKRKPGSQYKELNQPSTQNPPQSQLQPLFETCQQAEFKKVIIGASKILSDYPSSDILYSLIGTAYQGSGNLQKALEAFTKALAIKADSAETHNNIGVILESQGRLGEAIKAYDSAILIKPDYAKAVNNLGNALKGQGKLDKAIEAYNNALRIKPDYADAQNNLGMALYSSGHIDGAVAAFKDAISLTPNSCEIYNNLGIALEELGKPEEALEAYKKAISINPNYATAYNSVGSALQDQGKLRESIKAYQKAISINPLYANAHRNLSSIRKYKANDPHFREVKKIFNAKGLSSSCICSLNFALAKMYNDIDEFEKAFAHWSEGNALRSKLLNYSIDQDIKLMEKLKKTQIKLFTNSFKPKKNIIDVTPIFILGMPRSGTTLVEQIVSSHSKIMGAGELKYISQYGLSIVTDANQITKETISDFRENYLFSISKRLNGQKFITDKTPQNFLYIPLICAALPEAKIIHVNRDAAATCWSNYKQYFASNGLGYSYDLKDVVKYYNLYHDLMKVWSSNYQELIYNLDYERLTSNQEHETRKLIEYLNLDWEQTCLYPEKNTRSVRTASQQQVRQGIFKGSSKSWQKYEQFIAGAFENLKTFTPHL